MSDEKAYELILTEKQIRQLEALIQECDAHEEWRSPRRLIGDLIQTLLESASNRNQ